MKESKYNFFYNYDLEPDKLIAYNAMTNTLALIDSSKYKVYQNFVEKGIEISDEEFIRQLKLGGFLIDDNLDELKQLRYEMFRDRFDKSVMNLAIAPTSDCIFRCVYCYEEGRIRSEYMTHEIQDAVITLIKKNIENKKISYLRITWYGGEPLMAFSIIKYLSHKIISLCEKYNITYNASIITNGYLVTEEIVNELIKCKISTVQITLDGNEETHNKKRILIGGSPTYKKIIKNLSYFIDKNINVFIRVNIDRDNQNEYKQILDILKKEDINKSNILPYIAWIDTKNDTSYNKDNCLSQCSFAHEEVNFDMELDSLGYSTRSKFYPKKVTSFCSADKENSYVIDSDGCLYSCFVDMGSPDLSKGNIIDFVKKGFVKKSVDLNYITYDATTDSECVNCRILPLCMGGCHKRRVDGHVERCVDTKYIIEQKLKKTAMRIRQTNSSKTL